jgi:uncharacterized membrane protein
VVDVLLATTVLGLAVYFLFRIARAFWPRRSGSRGLPGISSRLRCPLCGERLNNAELEALRQGRRKCSHMAECPYQRSRWLN